MPTLEQVRAELARRAALSTEQGASGSWDAPQPTFKEALAAGKVNSPAQPFIDTFKHGLSEAKDFITGNYSKESPALDELHKKREAGTADRHDYERAFMEGFANNPAGKALGAAAGIVPVLNVASTAINDAINPAIVDATGIDPTELNLVEMAAGPLIPKGASLVKNTALKAAGKALGVNPARVAEVDASGLPLNIPAVSDSPAVKGLANISGELPGGAAIRKSMDDAFAKADESIKSLGYTGKSTPTTAGAVVDNAFTRWRATSLKRFNDVDGALQKFVPDEAAADVAAIPETVMRLADGKGLTPRQMQENANHPALQELTNLFNDAQENGGTVPIGALKNSRTKIGAMLTDEIGRTKKDAIASRAYGAISTMLEDAAGQIGGAQGAKAFKLRNKIYSDYIDENNSFIGKLQKKLGDTPETIFNTLTSTDKKGASTAARVMNKLNPIERDAVRDAVIFQKGGADNFTIGKWALEYGKMSPEAKNVFFQGKPQLRAAHDDLIKGINNYKDVGKFGNPSRSGFINNLAAFVTGGGGLYAGGIPGALETVGTAYAANRALSSVLASPKATRLLARAVGAKDPVTYNRIITPLSAAMIEAGVSESQTKKLLAAPEPMKALPNYTLDQVRQEIQRRKALPAPVAPQSSLSPDISADEGNTQLAYTDTTGNRTVGHGFNMDSGIAKKVWQKAGIPVPFDDVYSGRAAISPAHSDALGAASYQIAVDDAKSFLPTLGRLTPGRQQALINLSYQLGGPRLKKFDGLQTALANKEYGKAARSIIHSEYYKQTPERARRVIQQILQG